MSEFFCMKTKTGTSWALVPAHATDVDAIKKLPNSQPVRVKVTRMRNPQFHRKFFALLNYLFDIWEPEEENHVGDKNFDRFRKDIVILAGFYERYIRLDGTTRIEPKSSSFANMDEDEFEQLYEKVIDVGIKYVARNYTDLELRAVIDGIMEFDS